PSASPLPHPTLPSFPTRRSSDLLVDQRHQHSRPTRSNRMPHRHCPAIHIHLRSVQTQLLHHPQRLHAESLVQLKQIHLVPLPSRSEEHTSELQSQSNLVCRLLLE